MSLKQLLHLLGYFLHCLWCSVGVIIVRNSLSSVPFCFGAKQPMQANSMASVCIAVCAYNYIEYTALMSSKQG